MNPSNTNLKKKIAKYALGDRRPEGHLKHVEDTLAKRKTMRQQDFFGVG